MQLQISHFKHTFKKWVFDAHRHGDTIRSHHHLELSLLGIVIWCGQVRSPVSKKGREASGAYLSKSKTDIRSAIIFSGNFGFGRYPRSAREYSTRPAWPPGRERTARAQLESPIQGKRGMQIQNPALCPLSLAQSRPITDVNQVDDKPFRNQVFLLMLLETYY